MMTMCHGIKKSKCELGMTRGKTDMILLEKKKKKNDWNEFYFAVTIKLREKVSMAISDVSTAYVPV